MYVVRIVTIHWIYTSLCCDWRLFSAKTQVHTRLLRAYHETFVWNVFLHYLCLPEKLSYYCKPKHLLFVQVLLPVNSRNLIVFNLNRLWFFINTVDAVSNARNGYRLPKSSFVTHVCIGFKSGFYWIVLNSERLNVMQLASFSALTVSVWVIWPVEIVPSVTYSVSSGLLSLYSVMHLVKCTWFAADLLSEYCSQVWSKIRTFSHCYVVAFSPLTVVWATRPPLTHSHHLIVLRLLIWQWQYLWLPNVITASAWRIVQFFLKLCDPKF